MRCFINAFASFNLVNILNALTFTLFLLLGTHIFTDNSSAR